MDYREADVPPASQRALAALDRLSGKWHPVVLVSLSHHGRMGFNELLAAIPELSGKVLSATLDALGEAGLVERHVVSESPLRVEYELTDAGRDMEPVFDALGAWGDRHLDSASARVVVADADRRLADMYGDWLADRFAVRRAHDGGELDARFDERVDVVLLDAELPGVDPASFVAAARDTSRSILVAGDRPDIDLLSVPADDALRKPLVRETAVDAVESQLSRIGEPAAERERASLAARRSLFEAVYTAERLASVDAYRDLCDRLDELEGPGDA